MRSEKIEGSDACGLSRRWRISTNLASMLVTLEASSAQQFSAAGIPWGGLFILSGYRSQTFQARVNPSNPDSKHSQCPAVAADLRVADLPASTTPDIVWLKLGETWQRLGGTWGGTFSPPDLNHFESLF